MFEKAGDPAIKQFKIPDDWMPPPLKSGEKKFEDVENPGKWPWFCYLPEFKRNYYIGHQLPTRAIPVPEDVHDPQYPKYWDFFYNRWESGEGGDADSNTRDRATRSNV